MIVRMLSVTGLILLLTACGSTSSSPSTPSTPSTPSPGGGGTPVTIVSGASLMTTTAYAPNPITVAVGGSVTWTNNDNTSHNATANDGSWNSGNMAPGATFTRSFPTAGSFPYHCTIHPGMVGTVVVQ